MHGIRTCIDGAAERIGLQVPAISRAEGGRTVCACWAVPSYRSMHPPMEVELYRYADLEASLVSLRPYREFSRIVATLQVRL